MSYWSNTNIFFKESLKQLENSYKSFVHTIMDNTSKRLDGILKEVEEIKTSLQFTQKDVDQLKESRSRLSLDCKTFDKDIGKLGQTLISTDSTSDYLEGQSRRNNLIIDDIPEVDGEKWADTELKVQAMFTEHLHLDHDKIEIERAHRIGKIVTRSSAQAEASSEHGSRKKYDRPHSIVVKLLRFKDRETVLGKANKLRGTNIYINEDYTEAVRLKRKELLPKMMEARKKGLYAVLRHDKLIVCPGRQQGADNGSD